MKYVPPMLVVFSIILAIIAVAMSAYASTADAAWKRTEASYYGPGFYGNRTACGQILTTSSWHVAHLGGTRSSCGMRVRICKRGTMRCVNVSVRDTGGYHYGRRWDLTVRVKRALRCPDICRVRWAPR